MNDALLKSILDPLIRIKLLLKTVNQHGTTSSSMMVSINERFKARHSHIFLATLSSSNATLSSTVITSDNKDDGEKGSEEEDVVMGELVAFAEDEWDEDGSEKEEAYTLDMRLTVLQVITFPTL